jgi:hypothetical protein
MASSSQLNLMAGKLFCLLVPEDYLTVSDRDLASGNNM